MDNLSLKYRLIWNVDSSIIQNDYTADYTNSITTIINSGNLDYIESNTYQDILDEISTKALIQDPSAL